MGKTSLDLVIEAAGVPESDPKKDAFHMALYMVSVLSLQCEEWAFLLKDNVSHELKYKLNNFLSSAKLLRGFVSKYIDYDALGEDSVMFSQILEYVKNAKTAQEQRIILDLLKDFTEGRVMVYDDSVNTTE